MKLFFIILFCILFSSTGITQGVITLQDKPFVYSASVDSVIWKQLSANQSFASLSEQEKQMYYWANVFRKTPYRFFSTVINEFLQQFPEANSNDTKSLEEELRKEKSLPFLVPDKGLIDMSRSHAKDLFRRNGVISHKSSSGKDFAQRIKEAGFYPCGAENIYIGTCNALEVIITLLIDYGVADKGHRKNLLNPQFERMGVSFLLLKSNQAVMVQELSCR